MKKATVIDMRTIILLLAITVTAYGSLTWSQLTVKWATEGVIGTDRFLSIPWTATDAKAASWVEVRNVNKLGQRLYCLPADARFCIIVDSFGNICGVQFGIPVADLQSMQSVYNMSRLDWYNVKNMFGADIWTATVYFVNPFTIAFGGRRRTGGVLGTEGVWIEKTSGYLAVSRTRDRLDPEWTVGACIKAMGTHYHYNMSTTMACDDIRPIFLLYQNDTLSGIGIQGYGKASIVNRNWWEVVLPAVVKPTIPAAPDCLIDWATNNGVISLHVYFTKNVWSYIC